MTRVIARSPLLLAGLLALGAPDARGEEAVAASTGAAAGRSVQTLYQGLQFRDPFAPLTGGGGGVAAVPAAKPGEPAVEWYPEDFNIHAVYLRGIMQDKSGAYALLVDPATGMSFVLKQGKVITDKKEEIPGVRGRINSAQKSVILMTRENDVQTLRLGETEEDAAGGAEQPKDEE